MDASSLDSQIQFGMEHKDEGPSTFCLTETGLEKALLEWWSTNIFALQTAVPAIKFTRIPDFKELRGVLPSEFGKGSMGTTGSVGLLGFIFEMNSILLLPDQQLGEKQPYQKEEAKEAR